MPGKKGNVVLTVTKIARPVAEELNLELWDVEFVKEGSSWYLRFYIDKPGGVTIEDCENFHRRIDPLIDEADPITQSYFMEVSSPGTERELKKLEHFEKMKGSVVRLRLIRPDENGNREITGILNGLKDNMITLDCDGQPIEIERSSTAFVRLVDEDLGE